MLIFDDMYIDRNRDFRLHKKVDVIKIFLTNTIGVEVSAWCYENCKGRWNFHEYYPKDNKSPAICEWHLELEEDIEDFKIYWKLAGLNFPPESYVRDNNLAYRCKHGLDRRYR